MTTGSLQGCKKMMQLLLMKDGIMEELQDGRKLAWTRRTKWPVSATVEDCLVPLVPFLSTNSLRGGSFSVINDTRIQRVDAALIVKFWSDAHWPCMNQQRCGDL